VSVGTRRPIRTLLLFLTALAFAAVAIPAALSGQGQNDTIELKGKWKPPGLTASITYSIDGETGIAESKAVSPVVDGWIWWTTGEIEYNGGPAEIKVRIPARGGGYIPSCEIWVNGHPVIREPVIEHTVDWITATCKWIAAPE
jgi:hypothetical protein